MLYKYSMLSPWSTSFRNVLNARFAKLVSRLIDRVWIVGKDLTGQC